MLCRPLPGPRGVQITILDIHNLCERFYFSDNVLIRLKSCITLLRTRLSCLEDNELTSIAFPDEGAFKRFHTKFAEYPHVRPPANGLDAHHT